jgi:pimeloyl-ACP methyl ester carboxylesterase
MAQLIMIPAMACSAKLYFEMLPHMLTTVVPTIHLPTAESYAEMVADFLATAPKAMVLLGTSMGARLAIEVAIAAPDRVSGLVLIGATAGPAADPAAGLKRSERLKNGQFDTVMTEMADMITHKGGPRGEAAKASFKQMARETGLITTVAQSDALAHRVDRWSELRSIRCPVLCLWGAYDKFSPPEEGKRIAKQVKNGTYVELPNCGHLPSLEYPAETSDAVLTWMHQHRLV